MQRRAVRITLLAACFLTLLTGGAWILHRRYFVYTNDAFIDGYQVTVSSDVEARLTQLFVDEGDYVKEGQLLCQLDETIFLSQKKDAETNVALLQEKVALQRIDVEKLRDIYIVAKQEYDAQIISFIAYDKIEKNLRLAEMKLKVAEAALSNGIAKLGVIEEWLRHTKIYAPRNGAIAKRWIVAGDVVQIGQPLFMLTDVDHIWVTANLEETKVQKLRSGDPVEIHIDAYPDEKFTGSVYVVRATAASQYSLIPPDNATGNFTKVVQRIPVKIWLDVPKSGERKYLYPGMSVEVDIKVR